MRFHIQTLVQTCLLTFWIPVFPSTLAPGVAAKQSDVPSLVLANNSKDPLPLFAVARLGRNHMRFNALPYHALISPDGKTLALGSAQSRKVWRWDLITGKPMSTLEAPGNGGILSIAFSRDGKCLIGGSYEIDCGTLIVWDAKTTEITRLFKAHDLPIQDIAFFDDDNKVASVSADGTVRWWEYRRGTMLKQSNPFQKMSDLHGDHTKQGRGFALSRLSANGSVCAALIDSQKQLVVWDLTKGIELGRTKLLGDKYDDCLAMSLDGMTLVSNLRTNDVYVWKLATGEPPLRLETGWSNVLDLALTGKGDRVFACNSKKEITSWDLSDKLLSKCSAKLGTDSTSVSQCQMALSADNKTLVVAANPRICVLDADTLKSKPTFDQDDLPVDYLAFNDDGSQLISGFGRQQNGKFIERSIRWNVGSWKVAGVLQRSDINAKYKPLITSLDNSTVVTQSVHGELHVLDTKTGQLRIRIKEQQADYLNGIAVDGRRLLFDSPSKAKVFSYIDVGTGKVMGPVDLTDINEKWSYALSPDGHWVGWYCKDNSFRVASLASRLEKWHLSSAGMSDERLPKRACILFSDCGEYLATWIVNEPDVRIWNLRTGKEHFRIKTPWLKSQLIDEMCLTFAPGGKMVGAGCADGQIVIWETATGHERMRLSGHTEAVKCLAFSTNGRLLASGSADTTVLIWDLWSK